MSQALIKALLLRWPELEAKLTVKHGEVTIEPKCYDIINFFQALRDEADFCFDNIIDICGVDYATYGLSEWQTSEATGEGFDRGVDVLREKASPHWQQPRFGVVYHLLSVRLNHRLRVRIYAKGQPPIVPTVVDVWPGANWFEREAFDLYGILFDGHPDLRRILTDYGFIGHPFRKDFPISGEVEMRYDAKLGRVIYQKVSIPPRVLVPRVIRRETLNKSVKTTEKDNNANQQESVST